MDLVHQYTLRTLQGLEHPATVPNLLDQLPRGKDLVRYLLNADQSDPAKQFPPSPIQGVAVLLEPCGTEATVKS